MFWSHIFAISYTSFINETFPASVVDARGCKIFALLHANVFVQRVSRLAI